MFINKILAKFSKKPLPFYEIARRGYAEAWRNGTATAKMKKATTMAVFITYGSFTGEYRYFIKEIDFLNNTVEEKKLNVLEYPFSIKIFCESGFPQLKEELKEMGYFNVTPCRIDID
jgi:hypothetical protein